MDAAYAARGSESLLEDDDDEDTDDDEDDLCLRLMVIRVLRSTSIETLYDSGGAAAVSVGCCWSS